MLRPESMKLAGRARCKRSNSLQVRRSRQKDWQSLADALDPIEPMATYIYETIPKKPKQRPRRFKMKQKMTAPPLKVDPKTGLPVRRVIVGGSGLVTHGASILSMNVKGKRH